MYILTWSLGESDGSCPPPHRVSQIDGLIGLTAWISPAVLSCVLQNRLRFVAWRAVILGGGCVSLQERSKGSTAGPLYCRSFVVHGGVRTTLVARSGLLLLFVGILRMYLTSFHTELIIDVA